MAKIILRDGIYIPTKFIDEERAVEAYTNHMYEESICKNCPYQNQRHSDVCEECEHGGYKGSICTTKEIRKQGKSYYKFPIGDRMNIEEKIGLDFDDFTIKDLRSKPKFKYKVKFTAELRDYQEPVFANWIKFGFGLTKSAPRTGKTVMGTAGGIELGCRVLIVADQKDFLDGFYETIMGGDNNPPMTNLPELEEKAGRKLVGFVKKEDDFKNFEIGLCTIQSFYAGTSGAKRLKWANENFGTLIIDEVHRGNASEFSRTISKLAQRYKFGLTATPRRKDCFTSDHEVQLADGAWLPIADVNVGMSVRSVASNGTIENNIVLETHSPKSDNLVEVSHEHGTLVCTEDHEFWVVNRQQYVKAIDLTSNDEFQIEE